MQDFDEHKDELNEAPFLGSLKKENIFRVPDDYFGPLPQVWETIRHEAEPETPVLDQIEKKNIFQIPEGYFETFAEKIFHLTQPQPSARSSRMGIVRRMTSINRFSVGIAAAIALFISFGIWFRVTENEAATTPLLLADISTEELMTSVDLAEVDLSTILDIVGDEAISDLQPPPEDLRGEELNDLLEDLDISDLEGMLEELDK
ncbi:MAG: hypothetical protein R3D00_11350 [Bacteroidia bacterium]